MLLTDKEIIDAVNDAPLGRDGATTVLSVGRAIEARVLAKHDPALRELVRLFRQPGGLTANHEQWQAAFEQASGVLAGPHGAEKC